MIKIINKKRDTILKTLGIMICLLTITLCLCFSYKNMLNQKKITSDIEAIPYASSRLLERSADYKQQYLSDLTPIEKRVGWRDLAIDADTDGNPITLMIENNWFTFKRGLFAHATSTLVYDLTEYSDYNYFCAFVGLNSTSTRGDGVTFHFYTSNDRATWNEVGDPIRKNPRENATFVSIPLDNAKYLKLVADANAGNGADHSVYADAKLVNEINGNFVLDSVEDIDNLIKSQYNNPSSIDENLEYLVLKRELVKKVGQYTINSFYNENEDNEAVINWLLNDKKVLNYYVLGGNPDGNSYYKSLTQLARLYKAYKDDFKIQERTRYGTELGDLYTRMAVALSLTHSQLVGLWMQAGAIENQSDAVVRYQIFKELHKNDKFRVTDNIDITKWFENYNVENMRFVMNNLIDDESIVWLNEYVQSKIDANPNSAWGLLTPHSYIAYVWPNYGNSIYYDEENYDYFNDLFSVNGKKLYDYGITRGTADHKVYKLWMNFRNKFGTGSVCGGISKSGSNIRTTHGIAATVIGQPGHAALLYYSEDSEGRGYWNIDNNVSGWTLSEKGERMLLGWGNASYSRGSYQVVYMALAQEVLNDYENFENAEKYLMLARAYSNDPVKQEELIRKAIQIQPINIDAWYDLIQLYNQNNTKSENDYYRLAEELADNLKYYPLPMYQLTNLIKPKLTSIENLYKFTLLQTRILNIGKNTPNNTADSYTVYQPAVTRVEASYLLGIIDSSIATFSFDGADAGKIVLSERFDGMGIRWDYSLDGKNNWNEVSFAAEEEHKLQLTQEQIRSITSGNDIYIHIVGVDYSEENLYKIDITDGSVLSDLFANDLENRVVGVNQATEWRYNERDPWVSYSVSSPDLTGNKSIQVRQPAMGTTLASPASDFFNFTEDNQPDTRKYIPVSHLSIHSVSTEATSQNGAAIKSIDGNYYTRWHSAWNGTDQNRFIVIKLDKPVVLSAVEFVPAGGGNGKIYDGTVYGSMNGEDWEVLSSMKNLTYTNQANTIQDAIANTKSFEIEDEKEVQYVKIVADRTNGNWFTAREFNLYQDLTKNPHPTAGVAYSTTEITNNNVIARLINPSTKITITNNGGSDTYIFTENGEFTFEFVDENGTTGSAVAKVDWIDKSIPDADVDYQLDSNRKISISLSGITEDVYLLDKNNNPLNFVQVKDKKVTSVSYLDLSGNVYKIVYVDENGCIQKIAYVNTNQQIPNVATYETIITNGIVTSEEYYDDHGNAVIISDNEKELLRDLQQSNTDPLEYTFEQSGDYEFKLLDKAKNIAYKSIKVDYENDIIIASDLSYDITHITNKNVNVTINPYVFDAQGNKEEAQIIDGETTYTFTENGKYTFKYRAKSDVDNVNVQEHTAMVNWIDKDAPKAEIKYITNSDGSVTAVLVNENEEIIVMNNSSSREYVFTKNGVFTFIIEDMAENISYLVARVDSIKDKEEQPSIPDKPENPDTPSIPEEPTNPSEPGSPTSPVTPPVSDDTTSKIPYNPSRPNNNSGYKNNTANNKTDEGSTSTVIPDEDNEESSDSNKNNNSTTKPNTDKKDSSKKEETETFEEKKDGHIMIKIILILLIILISSVTGMIYFKNRK